MVDESVIGFDTNLKKVTKQELEYPTDKRIFALASALKDRNHWNIEQLYEVTKIDLWFLYRLRAIVDFEIYMEEKSFLSPEELLKAKKLGFSDKYIARCIVSSELVIRKQRLDSRIRPSVKKVDTVSAEWPASTNYLYLTYNTESYCNNNTLDDNAECWTTDNSDSIRTKAGVLVLGSGVYRIGSSVEFDCCAVGCVQELTKVGIYRIVWGIN